MGSKSILSSNDHVVLAKLFDPESAPVTGVLIDPSLPSDPNILDAQTYLSIQKEEKLIIETIESVLHDPGAPSSSKGERLRQAYDHISSLIELYPNSASLRNDRAQLIRLQYGNNILICIANQDSCELSNRAVIALSDLDEAIRLLTPATPHSGISSSQGRVLAQAYTQRGALFHAAAKLLAPLTHDSGLRTTVMIRIAALQDWDLHDFEEAASKDFFLGGRYGNEIGKGLAVHTNPTAKLCGQMVQEAMKSEYPLANAMSSSDI
ncbi:hypothetical protein MMC14_003609 [Varicellaria rhodocarpa]|nr:hypothetical protein [Varicellaria rhodocarpa]